MKYVLITKENILTMKYDHTINLDSNTLIFCLVPKVS